MPAQWQEQINGRELRSQGGNTQAIRRFIVWSDDPDTPLLVEQDVFNDALFPPSPPGIGPPPKKGHSHPNYTPGTLVATDYTVTQVEGLGYTVDTDPPNQVLASSKTYVLEWTYLAFTPYAPGNEPNNFTQWGTTIRSEFIDVWRTNPDVPTNVDAPPLTDIGGNKIDQGGTPVSKPISQIVWQVELHRDFASITAIGDYLKIMDGLSGKRNSVNFLYSNYPAPSGDAGAVLYLGGEVTRTGEERYVIRHEFVLDSLYHCRQIAKANPANQRDVELSGGVYQTKTVYWTQPFSQTGNFATLGVAVS